MSFAKHLYVFLPKNLVLAEYNSWETPQVFTSQGGSNTPIQRERPDNVKAVWADPCLCPYGAPEEVCGSRVGMFYL